MTYLISHESGNTVNGVPVGRVYVRRVADEIPGYPLDVFSYTKDPALASTWPTEADADAECGRRSWRLTRVHEKEGALPL
jgi:hypothetical protein